MLPDNDVGPLIVLTPRARTATTGVLDGASGAASAHPGQPPHSPRLGLSQPTSQWESARAVHPTGPRRVRRREEPMTTMPKVEFLHILRRTGELKAAAELNQELPDPVDFDRDAEVLARHGFRSAEQLVDRLGGTP
jgi:hypothetical protein